MKSIYGYQTISAAEGKVLLQSGTPVTLVDLREPGEGKGGSIPGSISIPLSRLAAAAPRLLPRRDAVILVYCQTGARSWQGASLLTELGYSRVYDMGGYVSWRVSQFRP